MSGKKVTWPKVEPGSQRKTPGVELMSVQQVTNYVKEFSGRIFGNQKVLKDILDRHQPNICKRWTKKTGRQRRDILSTAWPEISKSHRPDLWAFHDEQSEHPSGANHRDTYLFPHLNLEDLAKVAPLLLMLESRSRNPPHMFAFADWDSLHVGLTSKAIRPPVLEEHTMMLTGRTTPETYGELVSWHADKNAIEYLHCGKGFKPGDGLIILHVQDVTMRFLLHVCVQILHDIPASELIDAKWPIQPQVAVPRTNHHDISYQVEIAEEAPYLVPDNMNLQRLESLLEAKKSAAEDHIWALREDPGYYADVLQDCWDHSQFTLKDIDGREHPYIRSRKKFLLWNNVICNVVNDAYLGLEYWNELHRQVQEIREFQRRYEDKVNVDKDLPEEYLCSLLKFQRYLWEASLSKMDILRPLAHSSPPLKHAYYYSTVDHYKPGIMKTSRKPGMKPDKVEYDLLRLINTLVRDGKFLSVLGFVSIVDELERLIRREKMAKKLISANMAGFFSDLSVIGAALREVNNYHPWSRTFKSAAATRNSSIEEEFNRRLDSWIKVCDSADGPNKQKIYDLGTPKGSRFYYPVDKKRSKANVESMRSAEQELDSFWRALDENLSTRNVQGTVVWRLLSQDKCLHRTPEWIEPKKIAKSEPVSSLERPLSEIYIDLERRTERTIDSTVSPIKDPKRKRRGFSTVARDDLEPAEIPNEPIIQQVFRLDARPLRVFRTLFYTPNLNGTPGTVPWNDFLQAMIATGFAVQKLYGSVWQFSPHDLNVQRSIHFHEPHPGGSFSYQAARRIGRRLNRAYGWEGSMFLPK